ncbi:MAG: hypothetical protein LV473_21000 [Nitrospira sp.]|nr:hypothetical protein [Nitrospira sp.]
MSEPIRINLNEVVSQITGVLFEPYTVFIAKLHAEGRITDEEVERLKQEFEDRIPQLYDLVVARQSQDRAGDSLPPQTDPQQLESHGRSVGRTD